MSEQIVDANLPTVIRFRKIVQFARELDVKCDANWITPLVAFAKLEAVSEQATDDTVDDLIADELASQSTVTSPVPAIGQVDAQVGVPFTWDFPGLIGEGLPALVSYDHIGGTLPTGVTYDPVTMIASGTPDPATEGVYPQEFAGVYADDSQAIDQYNLVVAPAA